MVNYGDPRYYYPDPVTGGVFHMRDPYSADLVVIDVIGPSGGLFRPKLAAVPDWWRCDACGHANAFRVAGEMQLSCPHCGAQMPKRYDP